MHNAVGAQYSIIRGDTANVSALSNGLFTVEAAVVEAVTLLGDGHPEVMIVVYDASPPPLYASHYDEPAADFAFAWRITRGASLRLETADVPATPSLVLPHGLSVLRFFLGTGESYVRGDSSAGWRWSRHG